MAPPAASSSLGLVNPVLTYAELSAREDVAHEARLTAADYELTIEAIYKQQSELIVRSDIYRVTRYLYNI